MGKWTKLNFRSIGSKNNFSKQKVAKPEGYEWYFHSNFASSSLSESNFFLPYNGWISITIHDTSWILEVEIEEGGTPPLSKKKKEDYHKYTH